MTDPWFTPEVYAIMPGLIVGLAGGTYGVLLGLFITSKNIRQYFSIMTISALTVCVGVIAFGIIATFFDQPEGTLYNFVSAGLIGVGIVIGTWYILKSTIFRKDGK